MADRSQNIARRPQASASMATAGGQAEAEIPIPNDVDNMRPWFSVSASQSRTVQPPRAARRVCRSCTVEEEDTVIPVDVESGTGSDSGDEDSDDVAASPPPVQSNIGGGLWSSTAVETALNNSIGAIPVVLTDPDVLDCPICLEPLSSPIFQCANGHITCNPCCKKSNRKCPSCCLPIGPNRCRAMEKLIDSITVDCKNKPYGCKEKLIYHSKSKHEQVCPHTLCYCPFPTCEFHHLFEDLYHHIRSKHGSSVFHFNFDAPFDIVVKRAPRYMFFAELSERAIFVLNHDVREHGRVFSVDCIGPNMFKTAFVYKLTVRFSETCFTMESVPEVFAKWDPHTPNKSYLTIPSEYPRFSIELCIKKA